MAVPAQTRGLSSPMFYFNSASGRLLGKSHRQGQRTAIASQNILPGSHDLWLRDMPRYSVSWCFAAFCRHCKCVTKPCLDIYPTEMLACVLGHSWSLSPVRQRHVSRAQTLLSLLTLVWRFMLMQNFPRFYRKKKKWQTNKTNFIKVKKKKNAHVSVTPLFSGFESWTLHILLGFGHLNLKCLQMAYPLQFTIQDPTVGQSSARCSLP